METREPVLPPRLLLIATVGVLVAVVGGVTAGLLILLDAL